MRSRAPAHAEELFDWTSQFLGTTHLEETPDETRLRHAACLLSDIAWRAHPDYRGEQSYDLVANAAFVGLDHPSRAFLALAASYRHVSSDQEVSPQARSLVSARQLDRARILGAAMRVAYIVSAAMPGVLPRTPMVAAEGPHRLDVAERPRAAQQRPVADEAEAIRPPDRRRSGGPGAGVAGVAAIGRGANGDARDGKSRKSMKSRSFALAGRAEAFVYEFGRLMRASPSQRDRRSGRSGARNESGFVA